MSDSRIRIGAQTLRVIDEGAGHPVLLLHGFPDSSHLWRHQIPVLVEAGFRVIVPDLRGFGDSDRPAEVEDYAMRKLVGDIVGLLDHLSISQASVVAHDWGAALAWSLTAFHPQRVERLAAMSVGHPDTFFQAGMEQRERSWYMLLFQFRETAEMLLTRDNWKLFRDLTRHHQETAKWIADLERPGALTAALNWYRANLAPESLLAEKWQLPAIGCSTLGIWSSADPYLTETQMLLSANRVTGSWRYVRLEGAGHWMQLDQPKRVNDLLLEFLGE